MRKSSCFILILIVLLSCSEREDYFLDANKQPEIFINLDGENQVSEINDSIKVGYTDLSINYTVNDENIKIIYVDYEKFYIHDSINNVVVFMTDTSGIYEGKIIAKDIYDVESKVLIRITAFDNLLPVPVLEVEQSENYKVVLKLSASFDQDAKYGGSVVEYYYKIGDFEITVPLNEINYQFTSSGNYNVEIKVKDNDNQWSELKVVNISIE